TASRVVIRARFEERFHGWRATPHLSHRSHRFGRTCDCGTMVLDHSLGAPACLCGFMGWARLCSDPGAWLDRPADLEEPRSDFWLPLSLWLAFSSRWPSRCASASHRSFV